MFSDPPLLTLLIPDRHWWALCIFQVQSHDVQQRILMALRDRQGVTALGAQRGAETFVIIDWDMESDEVYAKQVVMAMDHRATITYVSRERAAVPVEKPGSDTVVAAFP